VSFHVPPPGRSLDFGRELIAQKASLRARNDSPSAMNLRDRRFSLSAGPPGWTAYRRGLSYLRWPAHLDIRPQGEG